MSRSSKWLAACWLTVAVMLSACTGGTVYHHYEHTPTTGWEKVDTLFFDVPPVRKAAILHEEVELRIDQFYPFQGLSLIVHQSTVPPAGSGRPVFSRTDTVNCSLIDNNGSVKGQGISYFQYHFHLPDVSLSEGDSMHIAIRHNMRREIITGIVDVGIHLKR